MLSEKDCADRMIKLYGNDAGVHCVYNLMKHDRGSLGFDYWWSVGEFIRLISLSTARSATAS